MVKMFILSEYSHSPPTELAAGRIKIEGGPLYDLARVQSLALGGGLNTWTDRCDKTVYELFGGDLDAVATLMSALQPSNYRDSEWCSNGRNAWAACDAYSIRRVEWVATAAREMPIEYFLKFAVSKTGQLVMLVSCHL